MTVPAIAFDTLMEDVVARLLGEPNHRLSKPPKDVRYGTHGSLSINLVKGVWHDHEANVGGGVIDLVMRERDCSRGDAIAWLEQNNLLQRRSTPFAPKLIATYDYTNESGGLLFQVVRLEPKDFRQRRPDGNGGWIWQLGETRRVLYRLPELHEAIANGRVVFIVEGEKDVENLRTIGVPATCNPGGAGKWRTEYSEALGGADVAIVGDNDQAGRDHVESVAAALHGIARRVRVLDLVAAWPECPAKGDVSDWLAAAGTAEKLNELIEPLADWRPKSDGASSVVSDVSAVWPEPKPLPSGLAPVQPFDTDFMPTALAPWIDDIANRLQCPPDYVAVAAVTALGSVIGRRVGIKPQVKTDWIEIPNLWGCFIGRPGMLKSPAMNEALRHIHRLEAEAAKENEIAQEAYEKGLSVFKIRKEVAVALEKARLKKSGEQKVEIDFGEPPAEPIPVRYRTNDSSYESLGELLIDNPTGILIERDELISLLKHLDRDDQSVARGFYLTGWGGASPYTFDRITRGHRHIEAVCLSVLGNTQPARICEYVRKANWGGAGGDGLIQRFGLMVWPDAMPDWRNVDEYPNGPARERTWQVFERASKLDLSAALALGATRGPFETVPCFRFDEAAHDSFLGWRSDLERRLRSGEMSPALEGHLAKYRKLVPALALINHIAEGDQSGAVSEDSLLRALAFANYLEGHARRVYSSGSEAELAAGKAILKHIHRGDLKDGFTAREIQRAGWAHLTEREHIGLGLQLLVDLDYLDANTSALGPQGGRPKVTYVINPRSVQ